MGRGAAPGRGPLSEIPAPLRAHLLDIDEVFHVGTLDPARRGEHGSSLEGGALSVSLDPEAWRSIARLGDAPTWTLRRVGGLFVDAHALLRDRAAAGAIRRWARAGGYLARTDLYVVSWYDDEWERTMQTRYADRAEAEHEAPEGARIRRTAGWAITAAAAARAGRTRLDHVLADDLALLFYTEDAAPAVDGVWWDDADDRSRLSAPRGALLPGRLGRWTVSR